MTTQAQDGNLAQGGRTAPFRLCALPSRIGHRTPGVNFLLQAQTGMGRAGGGQADEQEAQVRQGRRHRAIPRLFGLRLARTGIAPPIGAVFPTRCSFSNSPPSPGLFFPFRVEK